jgi:hypothetical protein
MPAIFVLVVGTLDHFLPLGIVTTNERLKK